MIKFYQHQQTGGKMKRVKTNRVFAYIVKSGTTEEMICPKCALDVMTPLKGCQSDDYSFGYEVIGCYWCNETLNTPF